MPKQYTVSWTVIIEEANGPLDAVLQAQERMTTDASATVWKVTDNDGHTEYVEA